MGGNFGLVIYYNVNTINDAVVTAVGTNTQILILISTDEPSTLPTPLIATNIITSPSNFRQVYTYYNSTNAPLILQNISWSGVPYPPRSIRSLNITYCSSKSNTSSTFPKYEYFNC